MKTSIVPISLLSLALSSASLHAAVKFWDINGATAGSGQTTGTGTWNTTGSFWTTDSTGSSATTTFATDDIVVFSAGTDAIAAFTMTCPSSVSIGGMTNEEGGVSLSGAAVALSTNTITIKSGAKLSIPGSSQITASSGATMVLDGGTMENTTPSGSGPSFVSSAITITVTTNGGILSCNLATNVVIVQTGVPGTIISGPGGITKIGPGILSIATACTYSGSTTINNGTLRVRTSSNRLPTTTDITINSPGVLDPGSTGGSQVQQCNTCNGNGNIAFSASSTLIIAGTNNSTLSGIASGGGSFNKQGTGILTFNGVNTYSGAFTNTAGTTTVNSSGLLCGPVADLIINGGTVNLNNSATAVEDFGGTGGTLNLSSGHNLTISATFTDPRRPLNFAGAIAGAGNLLLTGTLTETLSGANTYSGSTTINAGASLFTTSASTGAGSFTNNGTLGVRPASAGGTLNINNLTLGSGSKLEFDYNYLGFPATKLANAAGTVTLNGPCTVNVRGFIGSTGTATLLQYVAEAGGGSFTLGALPPHVSATLNDDTLNKMLELVVTAADSLVWDGGASGVWDANNSANTIWKLASSSAPTYYQETSGYLNGLSEGDAVLFNDTATGVTTINLTAPTVSPYTITFNNTAKDYVLSGTGALAGVGTLTKNGTGQLTILTANSYTGGTTLNAGSIAVGNTTPFGTTTGFGDGKLTINAGTIKSDGATARTIAVPVTMAGDVTLGDAVNTGTVTFSGAWTVSGGPHQITVPDSAASAVISGGLNGTDTLTKAGPGTLDFTAASTFTGGINHNAGTLRINNNTALGAANSPVVLANGVTLSTTAGTARTGTYAWTVNGSLNLGQAAGGTAAVTMAGSVNLAGAVRTITLANSADTISGVITNGGLTLNSAGILTISGANNYNGDTTVNAGQITWTGSNAGSSATTVNPTATLQLNGSSTLGSGTLTLAGGKLNTSANRSVTTAPVGNPLTLTANSEVTTTSAATTVNLNFTNNAINSGGFQLTLRNDGADAATDVFEPRFSGAGFNFTGPIVIDNGATGQTKLDLFNTNGTSQTFSGVISGDGSINRSVSGGTGGTTILTAANTYSGGTVINGGTLLANNSSGSATGTGAVTVNSGILGGTGSVGGPVIVNSGGAINPGASPGTLVLAGDLTCTNGTYAWELGTNSTSPGSFDVISMTGGNLALGSASKLSVNFTGIASPPSGGDTFWNANHSWTVLTLTAPASNPGNSDIYSVLNGVYPNGHFTTSVNGGGELVLNYTAGTTPRPQITSLTGLGTGTNTISFTTAIKGASYQVQYTSDLNLASWTVLGTFVVTTPGSGSINDPNPPSTRRFYRIVIL
jgi:autotransporter-associated beta strand protein